MKLRQGSNRNIDIMNTGNIQVILGPMWSGKSSELLRRFRLYKLKYKTCIIKYSKDTRYSLDASILTHDKLECRDDVIENDGDLGKMKNLADYDVICIDEGQFFKGLVDFCEHYANVGKTIIVAGLDGDFKRRPFGETLQLIPKAEEVVKLSAICSHKDCKDAAAFTHLHNGGVTIDQDTQELIGGSESYQPYCRKHYLEFNN